MKPKIALVHQNLRMPFIFEEARAAGVELTLVHAAGIQVPPDLPAVTRTLAVDIHGAPEAGIAALRELAVDGVMTLFEPAVPFVARAAAALGLAGVSLEAALAARDKHAARERFRAAGMNAPDFVKLTRPADLARAEGLRFPVVVKPTSGYSSQGVIRADDVPGLHRAVAQVSEINREKLDAQSIGEAGIYSGVLVEEFLAGPEYAVESFVDGDRVFVLSIGYKGDARGPYFEEGVYLAAPPLPELVGERIAVEVARAARALGIDRGPTHTELRVVDGRPFVLEVGARIGGSGISHYIVEKSCEINLARLAIDAALGRADTRHLPDRPAPVRTAGNYIMPVHGHGTVARLRGLDELRRRPEVAQVIQFMFPGDVVQAYPRFSGYPAFVLTQHASYAQGEAFYRELDERLRIEYVDG